MQFYERVVRELAIEGSVLVICGGPYDAEVLRTAGITNATISNVDTAHTDYGGFAWSFQDAEALTLPDRSFDWCIVHAGLHHCASPHRALLEMMRVARKGILVIEARDSALMRLAVRLGFTSDFEIEAVVLEGEKSGGMRNSAIPNFIYRWTEREIRKTVESAYPQLIHEYRYFYGLSLPTRRLAMKGGVWRIAAMVLGLGARVAQLVMPRQGNQFAAIVRNTGRVKPWMSADGMHIRADYRLGFDPALYR